MPPPDKVVVALHRWFAVHARDLPWRRTRDPYAIWISEVMLQQTQVATVIPYWERWMRVLPDVAALARAPEPRVLKLWEGLGYYRRARNLRRAAQVIVREKGGAFPLDFDQFLQLPGVGRYTAGAVCSLAFNAATPVLDGNVTRVLARLHNLAEDVRLAAAQARLWRLAEDLVRAAAGAPIRRLTGRWARRVRISPCGTLNEALMELGAVVCTPRKPRCPACPLKVLCAARAAGTAEELPRKSGGTRSIEQRRLAFVIEQAGRRWVRQRGAGLVNGGLWEFPEIELGRGQAPLRAARAFLGDKIAALESLTTLRHTITRHRIRLEVYRVAWPDDAAQPTRSGRWITERKLAGLPLTAAHRRIACLLTGDAEA